MSLQTEGFNPRARAGRDTAERDSESRWAVSIHAPARGATFASNVMLN